MNPFDVAGLGLGWLGRASWQASVLALLVLGVQWGFRERLTPRWRHALWWLVLIRLILPVAPESSWSLFNLTRMERARSQPAMIAVNPSLPSPIVNRAFDELRVLPAHPPALGSPIQVSPGSIAPDPSLDSSGYEWIRAGIVWVWLLGVIIFGGRLGLGSYWLGRQLRHRAPVENPAVLAVLAECEQALGMRHLRDLREKSLKPLAKGAKGAKGETRMSKPRRLFLEFLRDLRETLAKCQRWLGMRGSLTIIATPAVESPALFGWVRARLLIPSRMLETFTSEEWRHVLMHELAHLRRRDVLVNGLMAVVQALHWFNPLIWFAFYRMRADREMACDALALSFTREDEVKSYGQTIIKLLAGFTAPVRGPGLVGILEGKGQIKRRIGMIAQYKKTQRRPVLSVLLMAGLCAIGMTDAPSKPKPAAETTRDLKPATQSVNTAKETLVEVEKAWQPPVRTGKEKFIDVEKAWQPPAKTRIYAGAGRMTIQSNLYHMELDEVKSPTTIQGFPQPGMAKVAAIRGAAQYIEPGGDWMPLKVGRLLRPGTLLKTAAGSYVDLFFKANGPAVRVPADATLSPDRLMTEGDSYLYPQHLGAKVMAIRGTAQYSEAGWNWMPLKVGKRLHAGTVLKTAAGSRVDVFFEANHSVVRVPSDTTLGLDELVSMTLANDEAGYTNAPSAPRLTIKERAGKNHDVQFTSALEQRNNGRFQTNLVLSSGPFFFLDPSALTPPR